MCGMLKYRYWYNDCKKEPGEKHMYEAVDYPIGERCDDDNAGTDSCPNLHPSEAVLGSTATGGECPECNAEEGNF